MTKKGKKPTSKQKVNENKSKITGKNVFLSHLTLLKPSKNFDGKINECVAYFFILYLIF